MPQPTRRSALGYIASLPFILQAGVALAQTRPTAWAVPIMLAGAPDLHRVTPLIYRSAQPDAEGFRNLATLGIKTVINLRRTIDDTAMATGTGLRLIHIKIKTRHVTEDHGAKIVLALRAVRQAQADGPVLVHCTHGADRTGMIIALWRMLYQGWSRDAAITELTQGNFGFHAVWINIPHYLRGVDLQALQAQIEAA